MASSLLSRLIRSPSTQKGSPLLHSYSLAGALLLLLVPFPTLVASTPPASLLLLFLILTPAPFLVPVHVSWSSPPLSPFLHASCIFCTFSSSFLFAPSFIVTFHSFPLCLCLFLLPEKHAQATAFQEGSELPPLFIVYAALVTASLRAPAHSDGTPPRHPPHPQRERILPRGVPVLVHVPTCEAFQPSATP